MLTPADRKYLGWTVGLFVLLGLVGAGTLLYRPFRLAYVIHHVRHTTWDDLCKSRDFFDYINSVDECAEVACKGNRLAMEAVIDASGLGDGAVSEMTGGIAYRVVAKQPEAFFEVLSQRPP